MASTEEAMQVFNTGANRNLSHDKLDYEGFISPLVLERYAQYMHKNRKLPDGSFRDSDNWQLGIPLNNYMKSGWRHFMDWWKTHRGIPAEESLEDALCALIFNAQGYLHETLKAKKEAEKAQDETDLFGRRRGVEYDELPGAGQYFEGLPTKARTYR